MNLSHTLGVVVILIMVSFNCRMGNSQKTKEVDSESNVFMGTQDSSWKNRQAFKTQNSKSDYKNNWKILSLPLDLLAKEYSGLLLRNSISFESSNKTKKYNEDFKQTAIITSGGEYHIILENEAQRLERFKVGNNHFVKHNIGPMRKQNAQSTDSRLFTRNITNALGYVLNLGKNQVGFRSSGNKTIAGVNVEIFELLKSTENTSFLSFSGEGEHVFPSAWMESGQLNDIEGHIAVDQKSQAVIEAMVQIKVAMPDNSSLLVTFRQNAENLGEIESIPEPKHILDHRRQPKMKDPLSFYRHKLPKVLQEESE